MKPTIIRAIVAGVHAGLINAVRDMKEKPLRRITTIWSKWVSVARYSSSIGPVCRAIVQVYEIMKLIGLFGGYRRAGTLETPVMRRYEIDDPRRDFGAES